MVFKTFRSQGEGVEDVVNVDVGPVKVVGLVIIVGLFRSRNP